MESDDDDLATSPLTDILFSPPNVSILILSRPDNSTGRIDRSLKVQLRDDCSAELVLYNDESASDDLKYILDLRTVVYKEEEEVDSSNNLCSVFYQLQRDGEAMQFQVIPTSSEGFRDVQAFDFILGQYAMKDEVTSKNGVVRQGEDRNPNLVAQGFENTGAAVRIALRSGGRYTGHAIRFLGQQYTSIISSVYAKSEETPSETDETHSTATSAVATSDPTEPDSAADDSPHAEAVPTAHTTHIDGDLIDRATRRKKWAEGVHSAATSITGAALYPVRWTGRMASQLGGKGGSDRPSAGGPVSSVVLDTVGGIGNGIMSVCKGVTEAIGEVGSAIGDSAMHHSVTCHGVEYADNVTRHYVDAASEIGLAGYKVANVASLGWQGVLVNAALEGTTFLVSLYEYLIGPVLLQGYMEMMQMPLVKVRRYFVVLRPWSVAFYKSCADITRKPYKVVPTSMLDTLPKLRMKSYSGAKAEVVDASPASSGLADVSPRDMMSDADADTPDSMYWHRSDYDAYERNPSADDSTGGGKLGPEESASAGAGAGASCSSDTPAGMEKKKRKSFVNEAVDNTTVISQLGGGEASHIEICTVDCSTFLLYPPEEQIHLWFQELSEAAARVETIAKRKSGADEIALYRRLELYPISATVTLEVKRFIRTTPKPSLFDMFIRKQSALNTQAEEEAEEQPMASAEGDSEDSFQSAGEGPCQEPSAVAASHASSAADNLPLDTARAERNEHTPTPPPARNLPEAASDDEGEYECEEFWASEEPGFLDGSYCDVTGDIARDGEAPADRSAPESPVVPLESSPVMTVPVESRRTSPLSATNPAVPPSPVMAAAAVRVEESEEHQRDLSRKAAKTTNVAAVAGRKAVSRPFYSPELQCSVYPVCRSGKSAFFPVANVLIVLKVLTIPVFARPPQG
jgi:hypothetical protein